MKNRNQLPFLQDYCAKEKTKRTLAHWNTERQRYKIVQNKNS